MTDLRAETLLTTAEAAEVVGVHHNTIGYWIRTGVHGVKLETVRIGFRVCTSEEALERFHEKMQAN